MAPSALARVSLRGLVVAAAAVATLVLGTSSAAAAIPSNDDFANASVVDPSSLPFNDNVDITDATVEPNEPSVCTSATHTVWYALTPASSGIVRVDTSGSSFYDTILKVYRQDGSDLSGLSLVGCASPYWDGRRSLTFDAARGSTYYVEAGSVFGSVGTLGLSVEGIPPPANDDFANATAVGSLPFSDTVDTTGATLEQGEPSPCSLSSGSAWYTFTPSASGSVSARTSGYAEVAAYTGSSLADLTSLGCNTFNGPVTFHVDAGKTYRFQVGSIFGQTSAFTFSLDVTPPPQVQIGLNPFDPSVYDSVQFYDQSYDPGNVGIRSESWSFGDGATATGCCPSHRYAADGDYTVKLDVTTTDGRTGSGSQVIHVRTHDVAIAKITVPQSASTGQTRSITVGLTNARYGETVQVQLFKSTQNQYDPFQVVGTLQQSVPVRSSGRTTSFAFSYTFTADDAAIGKVTFKAVATIVGARDANAADNTAIALPTKVYH